MHRFLLKPKWLAFHLLVVAAVVLMVNLGFWQLHRWQDRREFNDEVRTRAAMATVEFGEIVTTDVEPEEVAWRTATVAGTYLADEQLQVINRSQAGVPGVHVITPLQLDSGSLVLVNRGFVAATEPVPAPPTGVVSVTGRLHGSEARHLGGLTDPEGELTEIQRIDIDRIAPQLPGPVAPVFIDLVQSEPAQGSSPIPIADPELSDGPHLSYMIQWWIFSIAVVAGWVLAVRRSTRANEQRALPVR